MEGKGEGAGLGRITPAIGEGLGEMGEGEGGRRRKKLLEAVEKTAVSGFVSNRPDF